MDLHSDSDCTELLLDALCYEAMCGRLSPEMEDLIDRHLRSCSACRNKVVGFSSVLHEEAACANFG